MWKNKIKITFLLNLKKKKLPDSPCFPIIIFLSELFYLLHLMWWHRLKLRSLVRGFTVLGCSVYNFILHYTKVRVFIFLSHLEPEFKSNGARKRLFKSAAKICTFEKIKF